MSVYILWKANKGFFLMPFSISQKLAPTWDELGQSFETDPLGNKMEWIWWLATKNKNNTKTINF